MTIYENDPRVTDLGDLRLVKHDDGRSGQVWSDDQGTVAAWWDGHPEDRREFATADDAIRSLIGEPQ
jgi:hypothetical protein